MERCLAVGDLNVNALVSSGYLYRAPALMEFHLGPALDLGPTQNAALSSANALSALKLLLAAKADPLIRDSKNVNVNEFRVRDAHDIS